MIYLTKEELVRNIAEQTERAAVVIEHTDFSSEKINPNTVIIPFLSNIFDYALVVTAIENNNDTEKDCHRNALSLVMSSGKTKTTTKNFIRKIQELRSKYAENYNIPFDSDECLDFLNAYDCFMFEFLKSSETVKKTDNMKFSSFRNMADKLIRKSTADTVPKNPENELLEQLVRNNSLIEKLIEENQKINKRLDDIIKLIDNGG